MREEYSSRDEWVKVTTLHHRRHRAVCVLLATRPIANSGGLSKPTTLACITLVADNPINGCCPKPKSRDETNHGTNHNKIQENQLENPST